MPAWDGNFLVLPEARGSTDYTATRHETTPVSARLTCSQLVMSFQPHLSYLRRSHHSVPTPASRSDPTNQDFRHHAINIGKCYPHPQFLHNYSLIGQKLILPIFMTIRALLGFVIRLIPNLSYLSILDEICTFSVFFNHIPHFDAVQPFLVLIS